MSVVLAMLAVTATCVPSDQPKLTKLETANAFFTAFNAHDQATLGSLLKPGARIVMGPNDSLELADLLGQMPAEAKLEVVSVTLNDAGDVVARTKGNDGHENIGIMKIEGGCIAQLSHGA